MQRLFLLGLAVWLAGGEATSAPASPDYLALVRRHADAMIQYGRDTYGAKSTPIFVSTIDLKRMQMPQACSTRTKELYSKYFRMADFSTSANPMFQIDLFQLLEALTRVTGDPKYKTSAEESLKAFFTEAQSPATGLMAWGEHLGWDLIEDRVTIEEGGKISDTHEFYGPWTPWDTCFRIAPEASKKLALGLWEHQIADHKTCEFSRHAHYAKHGPGKGYEFAREGGFYIASWATAYAHTKDPVFLEAVEKLLGAYQRWQNPKTGLLPFETKSPHVSFTQNQLSFMVDVWDASQKVPAPLSEKMQKFVQSLDESILKLKHDFGPHGKGFAKIADADTGEVTNRGMFEARSGYSKDEINRRYYPYGGLWSSWYGAAAYTDARHGMICYQRYLQCKRPEYRALVVAVADRYVGSLPDCKTNELTPKTLVPPMVVLNGACRLTGDRKYLAASEALAKLAIDQLMSEKVPLPYATQWKDKYPYYAAVSWADSMMMMFLDLWLLKEGRTEPLLINSCR